MSEFADRTSGFIDDLTDAARRNPVSAALIGMGVVWLFAGRFGGRAGDLLRSTGLDRVPDAARDTLLAVGASADTGVRAVKDATGASLDAVRATGASVARQSMSMPPTRAMASLAEHPISCSARSENMLSSARFTSMMT